MKKAKSERSSVKIVFGDSESRTVADFLSEERKLSKDEKAEIKANTREFTFETIAERKAFFRGIDAGVGYLECYIIEPVEEEKFKKL